MTNPSRHAVAAIARTSRSQRGFALLITITLLAFLVLLLV
jgi:Tfp pilus assembly protein PilX